MRVREKRKLGSPPPVLALTLTLSLSFFRVHQVDRVALITSLGARMRLVAVIASLHRGTVGPKGELIMLNVTVAIDAQSLILGMKLVREFHDPNLIQVRLLSSWDRRMAA